MKRIIRTLCFASVFLTFAAPAADRLKVVTSTTDLAWAAKEIGGDKVEVTALLKGTENPHYIDAVPEYIRLAADAQVVCIVGLELEIGWMPKILSRSGNAQVQPGGKGYCEAGKAVEVLEKPKGNVDRSMGDVHPAGNPHFWLSPVHLAQAAGPIAETLIGVDPANALAYQNGLKQLRDKLEAIRARNAAKLKPYLAGGKAPLILEYHREFAYFMSTYGLKSAGSIEEKPGVTPSAGRLAQVALAAKAAGVPFAIAADTAPKRTLEQFSELSGLKVIQVPLSIQPSLKVKDYGALADALVDAVVAALPKPAQAR